MQRYKKDIFQTNNLSKNDKIQRNNSSKIDKIQGNNQFDLWPATDQMTTKKNTHRECAPVSVISTT